MEILGRFNKRLYKVQALNDLERRWQRIDANSPYTNHSEIRQNKRNSLDITRNSLSNDSLESSMSQKRTHAKIAGIAARSYWRCTKNPDKISLVYGQAATSPIKVTMSYGKFARVPATAQKTLVLTR